MRGANFLRLLKTSAVFFVIFFGVGIRDVNLVLQFPVQNLFTNPLLDHLSMKFFGRQPHRFELPVKGFF